MMKDDTEATKEADATATATKEPEVAEPIAMVETGGEDNNDHSLLKTNWLGENNNSNAQPGDGNGNRNALVLAAVAVVVIIIIVVLAVTLSGGDDEDGDVVYVPLDMDFRTGVSLITYYNVNATINQRLARTVLTMEIANALDCTAIHGVTLQLPLSARVASLHTIADDGCTTTGEVQALEDARDTFAENAAAGLPGAYVEARSDVTYSLQVSLPKMGTTVVELVVEELLQQKVGQVEFQLPLVPNEQVDQISLEVTILDASSVIIDDGFDSDGNRTAGISFDLDLGPDLAPGMVTSPFKLEIPDAREHDLPRVLRGDYKPSALPDQGVLFQDGNCFEYTFLPGSLDDPKVKNIFFLLDVSGQGDRFLTEAKTALKDAIDQLTAQDTLTIQTYGSDGTVDLWGSSKATDTEKEEAKKFVDEAEQTRWGCNLHEALLEGLLRAKRDAEGDNDNGAVTLMVVISNSWANIGNTNRTQIAGDVWNLNEEGSVKIFSLGSPAADNQLLNAIAVMNGGVTTAIVGGTIDHKRLSNFFESEFGSVLLSDVSVAFQDGAGSLVYGETRAIFPVLAQGTEVVVRGLLNHTSAVEEARSLQAVATAIAPDGLRTWSTGAVVDPFVAAVGGSNSRCFQSYAHSRITQLLRLRDVAILLGDGVVEPIVRLTKPCNETTSLADCMKAEALSLALEAQIVTRGLTGLVTLDDDVCLPIEEEPEICLDGTNKGDFWETDGVAYTEEHDHDADAPTMTLGDSAYNGYHEDASSGFSLLAALIPVIAAVALLADFLAFAF